MSIAKIIEEVKAVRDNHGVPTEVVDVLYALRKYEDDCYDGDCYEYLESENERFMLKQDCTDDEVEDCVYLEGMYDMFAKNYNLTNGIRLVMYNANATFAGGVYVILSIAKDESWTEFTEECLLHFEESLSMLEVVEFIDKIIMGLQEDEE